MSSQLPGQVQASPSTTGQVSLVWSPVQFGPVTPSGQSGHLARSVKSSVLAPVHGSSVVRSVREVEQARLIAPACPVSRYPGQAQLTGSGHPVSSCAFDQARHPGQFCGQFVRSVRVRSGQLFKPVRSPGQFVPTRRQLLRSIREVSSTL